MVDLIFSCRISRRESVTRRMNLFLLPNGKLEGKIEDDDWSDDEVHFFKNEKIKLWYKNAYTHNLEFHIPRSGTCFCSCKRGYIFSFHHPSFKHPFEIDTDVERYESFSKVLSSFNLSQVPLLTRGRNFTLRTFTPTLIDGMMDD